MMHNDIQLEVLLPSMPYQSFLECDCPLSSVIGCPKIREHLRTAICLSNFRISAFQAEPDLIKWQKEILIFMSVNPQINFSIELDVRLRNSEAIGKWTKDQSSCISPGREGIVSRTLPKLRQTPLRPGQVLSRKVSQTIMPKYALASEELYQSAKGFCKKSLQALYGTDSEPSVIKSLYRFIAKYLKMIGKFVLSLIVDLVKVNQKILNSVELFVSNFITEKSDSETLNNHRNIVMSELGRMIPSGESFLNILIVQEEISKGGQAKQL
jgi:hypothetical protein